MQAQAEAVESFELDVFCAVLSPGSGAAMFFLGGLAGPKEIVRGVAYAAGLAVVVSQRCVFWLGVVERLIRLLVGHEIPFLWLGWH